jgi:hypothetical protein
MKGAVFIALNDFIEGQYGIEMWEDVLAEAKPASGGIYTSVENYNDQELMALLHVICQHLNLDKSQALRLFGEYLFNVLNVKHPIFTSLQSDLFKFLSSVESIVHTEVRKLFAGVVLPVINVASQTDKYILLRYESTRKMCELAEGLIQGAAKHYKVNIVIRQLNCYHCGDDHCLIEVKIV